MYVPVYSKNLKTVYIFQENQCKRWFYGKGYTKEILHSVHVRIITRWYYISTKCFLYVLDHRILCNHNLGKCMTVHVCSVELHQIIQLSISILTFTCIIQLSNPILTFTCVIQLSNSILTFTCIIQLSNPILTFTCFCSCMYT